MKRFIKMLVAIFALCLVFCATPKAEAATVASGSCGTGVTWKLSDTGTLSVSGSGAMADYDSSLSSVPWRNYLGSIKTITFSSGVTHIGNYAFAGCVYAKTITIGTGVKTIGEGAFMACISVTSLNIPKAVTTIGMGAFAQCESLASCIYQVDAKLTTIETMAFYDCYALKRVKLPYSTRYIGIAAYENCIALNELYIQKGVEFIGDRAFLQCTALKSVDIPATAVYVGGAAFGYCTALTKITATSGGNFVAINNMLYDKDLTVLIQAATGMTGSCALDLPSSVTTIGTAAFAGTTGMTSVTIPDTVTTIDTEAFTNCTGLTSVTLPANLNTLAKGAFHGCSALTAISLPHKLAHIGESAFEGCSSLQTLSFGDSITAIGNDAFKNCTKLSDVVIPDTVSYLGHRAFYNCDALGNMTIPDSVIYYGEDVFRGCLTVKALRFQGDAPHFEEYAFREQTLTIFYLESNNTYTETVRQSYGGTVQWHAVEDFIYIDGGTCGTNARWWLKEDGTLEIYGTGALSGMYSVRNYYVNDVKRVVIEEGITSIGYQGFMGFQMTEIILPDSMTTIEDQAFRDCTALQTVSVSANSKLQSVDCGAFNDTPWMASRPEGATYFGKLLYRYIGGDGADVIVSEQTLYIADEAFSKSGVKTVILPESLQQMGRSVFSGCEQLVHATLPDSLTTVPPSTFYGCTSLTGVTFGKCVTELEQSVFSRCTALETLEIPETVKAIDGGVFAYCTSLKSMALPEHLTEVPDSIFEGCSALTSVTLSSNIIKINRDAFKGCGFTSFQVPPNVTYIYDNVFQDCKNLQNITFGNKLYYIGDYAFKNCTALENLYIPCNGTNTGNWVFEGCTALTTVKFGDGLKSLRWQVFKNCTNLKTITLPATVTDINNAFEKSSLQEVIFEGSAPESSSSAFRDLTLTAYYPAGDESWTESKRKTFKGTVTWVPYEKPEIEKFDIDVSRMILGNSLEFQFGVAMNKFTDTTGYYAVVEKSGVTKTIPATQWSTAGQYYAIVYDGLAAKEMADTISVTIYNAKGEAVSNQKTDSVRDYAARAFDSQDVAGKTMLVDMLNYGAAAQLHFDYNTADLANSNLTDAQKAAGTATAPEMSNDQVKGENYSGSRFILTSSIQVQLAFKGLTSDMYAIYTYTSAKGEAKTVRVEGEDFVMINGKPAGVELSALVYADARSMVEVTVYNADGTVYGYAEDSIESCCFRSSGEMFVALMKFADSAKTHLFG